MNATGFPRESLQKSKDERLEYFKNRTVNHVKLNRVLADVKFAIDDSIKNSSKSAIVYIIGPTGVGKTTLLKHLITSIWESESKELERDEGYIPITYVEAIPPDKGSFSFKELYIRTLIALNEPLIERKIKIKDDQKVSEKDGPLPLRRAVESALKMRKTKAIILDEAQHLLKAGSGKKAYDNLDNLKSLTNYTGMVHVLVGPYELLPSAEMSGQTTRRSQIFHFPRYHKNIQDERNTFRITINKFQKEMPLEIEPDLNSMWEFLFDRSLGCVGILKDWLYKALKKALEEDAQTITFEHLAKTTLTKTQCNAIEAENKNGEDRFNYIEKAEEDDLARYQKKYQEILETEKATIETKMKKKQNNRKPGERNPKRDPVGTENPEKMSVNY